MKANKFQVKKVSICVKEKHGFQINIKSKVSSLNSTIGKNPKIF